MKCFICDTTIDACRVRMEILFAFLCHRSVVRFWWVFANSRVCVRISYETEINVRLRSISASLAKPVGIRCSNVPCARDSLPVYRDRQKSREYFEVRAPSFVQKSATTTTTTKQTKQRKKSNAFLCDAVCVCVQLCHCWRYCPHHHRKSTSL